MKGCLFVVPTPIGNLQDITLRALAVLAKVSILAAEDTRSAQRLLHAHHQWPLRKGVRLLSYFEGNEAERVPELLEFLRQGLDIALISEAGMPAISDPGQRLIDAVYEGGGSVDVLPGPCAAITALVLSGLPSIPFTFMGFPPRQGKARLHWFTMLAHQVGTLICYESPHRIEETLQSFKEALGAHRVVSFIRELTKIHQSHVRASLEELLILVKATPPKGEITLVVAPQAVEENTNLTIPIEESILDSLRKGASAKETAASLALRYGKPRHLIYQEIIRIQTRRKQHQDEN